MEFAVGAFAPRRTQSSAIEATIAPVICKRYRQEARKLMAELFVTRADVGAIELGRDKGLHFRVLGVGFGP